MIKISIIIPVYNVEDYIEECLNSILQQTMSEDIECILVDDCGSDNSIKIAESIALDYKGNIHIKVLHNERNMGVGGARNTGIKAAQGQYLYFIDSDDYITRDCIESLWEIALKYPNADMIHGLEYTLNKEQNDDFHLSITKHALPEYSENIKYIRKESILNHYRIHVFNSLIKKDFIEKNNLYFINNVVFEDVPWMMACSRKINAVAFCKKDVYYYRQHASSIMGKLNPKWIESVAINSDFMLKGITLGDTYRIELFKIIEFMHIYDVKFKQNPIDMMEFGKSFIFSQLYKLMYKKVTIFGKLYKEILIRLFKLKMKFK